MQNALLTKNFLKVDNVVLSVASDISAKLNAKYKKNVAPEDVVVILESVFKGVPVAVAKGDSLKLPYIGKFGIKNKRNRYLDEDAIRLVNEGHGKSMDMALQEVINKSMY